MCYASRLVPVGLLVCAALGACTDSIDAPTAARPGTHASSSAGGPLRDSGIDRGDTHFSIEVVTTTTVEDGGFGAALLDSSLAEAPERTYIEGGYSKDGTIRFGVWLEDIARSPDVGSVRLAGGMLTIHDRAGVAVRSEPFSAMMEWAGFPGGSVLGAYFPSTPPLSGACDPLVTDCFAASSALPPGFTVQDLGDVREVTYRPQTAEVGAASASDIEIVQRYRRVRRGNGAPDDWRLDEIRRRSRSEGANGRRVQLSVSRHTYRAWHRNPARDRAREAAARDSSTRARILRETSARATAASAVSAALTSSTAPTATAVSDLCAPGVARLERVRDHANGRHVVYQHGFCADASVWYAFDDRLAQGLQMQTTRAYSLDTRAPIEDQVTQLAGYLPMKRPVRQLMIGHSQGGLVVRRFGQRFPEWVEGVITIGSPHLGSYLADTGPDEAARVLRDAVRNDCFLPEVCELVRSLLGSLAVDPGSLGIADFVPAIGDLRTNSAFQQMLNSTPELFPRISIEVAPPKRWVLARMLADRDSPSDWILQGKRPAGDAAVTRVQQVYAVAQWTKAAAASFLWYKGFQTAVSGVCGRQGFSTLWPACTNPEIERSWADDVTQATLAWLMYYSAGAAMDLMNGIDGAWDYLTTRKRDETDGLIHRTSQRYPVVPGSAPPLRLYIEGRAADSHSGQLKSLPVIISVVEAAGYLNRRVGQ